MQQLMGEGGEVVRGDNASASNPRKKYKKSERFKGRDANVRDLNGEIEGVPTMKELKDLLSEEDKAIKFLARKNVITIPEVCARCNNKVGQEWKFHRVRCRRVLCSHTVPEKCELCDYIFLQVTKEGSQTASVTCMNPDCKWEWKPGVEYSSSFFRQSILQDCKLPKNEIVHLLYLWLIKATHTQVCQQLGWHNTTATRWLLLCRQLVTEMMIAQPHDNIMIGGHGVIVEIDESKFAKRKYNKGRRVKGSWVLGMVERTAERRMVLLVVDERDKITLENAIRSFVHPGSTIHTDMWKGYIGLERLGYDHHTLCHEHEFVAADGVHTQTIEGNWTPLKRSIPVQCREGVDLQDYLFEYMWRRRNGTNAWEALLAGLASVRLTRRELASLLTRRERECEDDDESYNPKQDDKQDRRLRGEEDLANFGDMHLTPQQEEEDEDDDEWNDETLAYEVISELLEGGAIDRSVFHNDGSEIGRL